LILIQIIEFTFQSIIDIKEEKCFIFYFSSISNKSFKRKYCQFINQTHCSGIDGSLCSSSSLEVSSGLLINTFDFPFMIDFGVEYTSVKRSFDFNFKDELETGKLIDSRLLKN
jgi:hypothetical protein